MGQIKVNTKHAYNLVHDGILALGRAERQGMRVDVDYCEKKKNHLTRKINRLQGQLEQTEFYGQWKRAYGGKINLDSNHQLSNILYKKMKVDPPKTTNTGQGSTDEETLHQIDIPELQKILQIRKLKKIRDTYLDAFMREQVNGYIHPFYHLHIARTGRSSSSNPNWQNVPQRDKEAMNTCRRAIFPRPDHQILAFDFGGIEVHGACWYSEDDRLIYDVHYGDMHTDMAQEIYLIDEIDKSYSGEKNLRQGGKNGFVFPQFYGDYYGNNAPNLLEWAKVGVLRDGTPALVHLSDKDLIKLDKKGNIKKMDAFVEHLKKIEDDFWNRRYKKYKKWRDKTWEEYQKKGYIQMKTGFVYSGVATRNELLNAPIQGTAFHCLLWSFTEVDRISQEEGWDSRLCGQIHDEMMVDTNPSEYDHVTKTVKRVMCKDLPKAWSWINTEPEVEMDLCEVDASWATKKEYELPEV